METQNQEAKAFVLKTENNDFIMYLTEKTANEISRIYQVRIRPARKFNLEAK